MSLLNYFAEAEENKGDLKNKLIDLFVGEKPTDNVIHKFAEDNNISPHAIEDIIYEILYDIFHGGRAKGKDSGFDPEQIKMGLEVEKEHTDIPALAKKIVYDHLSENSQYYTYLKKMEDGFENKKNEQKGVLDQIDKYMK